MAVSGETISALLVGKQDSCLPKLKECLDELGMSTACVEAPSEVPDHLRRPEPPGVIFTAAEPADPTWMQVVEMARHPGGPPVIVASRLADVELYLDTLDRGAFDFVAAPFQARDLSYIVDSALARGRSSA